MIISKPRNVGLEVVVDGGWCGWDGPNEPLIQKEQNGFGLAGAQNGCAGWRCCGGCWGIFMVKAFIIVEEM